MATAISFDDVLDFLPLYPGETEDVVLARMRAAANEGLSPTDDVESWIDTREGSHFHVCVMPGVREIARLYDFMGTEVIAAAMPVWSWGPYLDDHATVQALDRLAATAATGQLRFTGPPSTVINPGTAAQPEPPSPDADVPLFTVTTGGTIPAGGTIDLPAMAAEPGEAGNVGPNAVVDLETPIQGVTVTNPTAMVGGTEAETDEALRRRVIEAYVGKGAGNRRFYKAVAEAWDGVGRATVLPQWNGPGTVKVVVTTAQGKPVSSTVVNSLQLDLDPVAGQGVGTAPVGAIVTVTTAQLLNVTVSATVEMEQGYSIDGSAGTVNVLDEISEALHAYIESQQSGGEVVLAKAAAAIVSVEGVHDVGSVELNGSAANVAISSDPARVPSIPTNGITLTMGTL